MTPQQGALRGTEAHTLESECGPQQNIYQLDPKVILLFTDVNTQVTPLWFRALVPVRIELR